MAHFLHLYCSNRHSCAIGDTETILLLLHHVVLRHRNSFAFTLMEKGKFYALSLLADYVLYCQWMTIWAILLVTVITIGCKTCFAAAGLCSLHLGLQTMTRQVLCLVTWQWHPI